MGWHRRSLIGLDAMDPYGFSSTAACYPPVWPFMDDLDPLVVICSIQYRCLELSHETGLEALAGLKGLRDLKIANMDHTMGAQEIGWMVREGV
ncbi:hypothetical protein BGZ59_000455 [Podila verticillata]|nr:hypothetical protein BGZ59_000455 [Podila verticillata]